MIGGLVSEFRLVEFAEGSSQEVGFLVQLGALESPFLWLGGVSY